MNGEYVRSKSLWGYSGFADSPLLWLLASCVDNLIHIGYYLPLSNPFESSC